MNEKTTPNPQEDEDDITSAIAEAFDKLDDEEPAEKDTGGFDIPIDADSAPKREEVNEDEGHKRVEDAQDKADAEDREQIKMKEPDAKDDDKPKAEDDTKPDDAKDDAKEDIKEDTPPELADDATFEAAMSSLDPKVKARIDAISAERDEVLAPLTARSAQLEAMGVKPKDAIDWFVKMNDYATRDPGEYAAYAIGNISGGDAAKIEAHLSKAAELHGFKLTKANAETDDDDDDDDPFEDPAVKAVKEENRKLKAQLEGNKKPEILGPDNPRYQTETMIAEFINETDADGNALRADMATLMPMITPVIAQIAQTSGRPITKAELAAAYDAAERLHPSTQAKAAARASQKSAAQDTPDVKEKVAKDAAAVAKAKAASNKIIEGSGQGAKPQPANDASGDETIEQFLERTLPQKL